MRRTARLVSALAGIMVAIVVAAGVFYLRGSHPSVAASGSPQPSSSLATVEKRTLSSRVSVNGTLGYLGSYQVVNGAQGHWTSLPAIGQVMSQGQTIASVDGSPVVLFYGAIPAYRDFRLGMSDGEDVKELERNLLALGYGSSSNLVASGHFDSFDVAAVKRWQKAMGLAQTGVISLGQVVFLPEAIRITSVAATLGSMAQPGAPMAAATSTTRRVLVNLSANQQSKVKVGDKVTITLPNRQTTDGTVSAVGTVATASGNGGGGAPTIEVSIAPHDPAATGTLDAAPVSVAIVTASVVDVLAIPVTALLAQNEGTYAVEVVDAGGRHRFIAVKVGLFDDSSGLVQVEGAGLAAGQRVVVAGT
jgi:peptidoglycan hydrolase-like protein with peptidoglycan-binding domain